MTTPERIDPEGFTDIGCGCGRLYSYGGHIEPGQHDPDCLANQPEPAMTTPPSGHVGTGEIAKDEAGGANRYRARCSCGWYGEWKFFKANANSQFCRHLGLVVTHPEIRTWEPEP